jgi:hypothetical protein
MDVYKILKLPNFTQDCLSIDKEKLFNDSSNILIETIDMARNCQYLKSIGLSSVFNKYFHETTGKFDQTRRKELINEFVKNAPLSDYPDYKDLIDKIHDNCETDLLMPGLPTIFTLRYFEMILFIKLIYLMFFFSFLSSGTISGKEKIFPFFWQNSPVFKMAMMKREKPPLDHLIEFVNQAGFKDFGSQSKGIFLTTKHTKSFSPVKNLPLCGISSSWPLYGNDAEPEFPKFDVDYKNRILTGLIFSASCRDLEFTFSFILSTVADFFSLFEREFFTVVEHIETGTLPEPKENPENNYKRSRNSYETSENKLQPNKERANELRLLANGDNIDLKNKIRLIWPKLSLICAVHSGPFETILQICRTYCSNVMYLNHAYASSEGFHADALPIGKNHYFLFKPNTGRSFLEFIPEDGGDILLPTELEVDKSYEIVVTSPLTGLLRYKLGDTVKMMGWFDNMPVISVCGRKDISLRNNTYLFKEEEFINCFKTLNFNVPFTFFMDRSRIPACLGVFLEHSNEIPENKEELSINIHHYLIANNQEYSLAKHVVDVNMPISIYFVRAGSFME